MKNDTYLVCRFTTPSSPDASRTGWRRIYNIISPEYMGAAEYEFGSIPKALESFVADSKKIAGGMFTLKTEEIIPNHKRSRIVYTKRGHKPLKKQPVHVPVTAKNVYVICQKEDADEVRNRIRLLALGKIRTKMGNGFAQALDPMEDFDRQTTGWFEMSNGFLFFLDAVIFEQVLRILQAP